MKQLKHVVAMMLVIAMMVTMVGCSDKEEAQDGANNTPSNGQTNVESPSGEEQITLRMWFGRQDFIPQDAFDRFHTENPNIKVEYDVIPLEQAVADFIRNLGSGNAPDVFQIFHQYTPTLVAQNAVMDMTPYFQQWAQDEPDFYNQIVPIAFQLGGLNGKSYGLGVHAAPFFQAYRLDWFNEAGLSEPETWEDVLDASRVLKSEVLGNNQYPYSIPGGTAQPPFWFSSIFMSMGGQYNENGLPQVDSEAGIALIDFYQTLAREDLVSPEVLSWVSGDFRGAFLGGNAAMFPEATNLYPSVQGEFDYGVEWECQVQPYRTGAEDDYRVNSFGWPYMVSSATEHPEAVAKLLRYLIDAEIVESVAVAYQPTTNMAVMSSDTFKSAQPWFTKVEPAFEVMDMVPGHIRQQEVNDTMNALKQDALTKVNVDPAELARAFQALLDELDQE